METSLVIENDNLDFFFFLKKEKSRCYAAATVLWKGRKCLFCRENKIKRKTFYNSLKLSKVLCNTTETLWKHSAAIALFTPHPSTLKPATVVEGGLVLITCVPINPANNKLGLLPFLWASAWRGLSLTAHVSVLCRAHNKRHDGRNWALNIALIEILSR